MGKKKKKSIWDAEYKEDSTEYARERGMEDEEEEHEGTHMEAKDDIERGLEEENIYSEEGRNLEREEDALEDWEQGFAEGAESKSPLRKIKKKKKRS